MASHGIKDLIDKLKKIEGKSVWIYISHDLYGDQSLKCAFQLLNNEKHIGFFVGSQEIYIERDKICNIGIEGELIYFADEIMCIKIRKL